MNLRARNVIGSARGKRDSLSANTPKSRDGGAMWKRMTVGGVAGASGTVAVAEVAGLMPWVDGLASISMTTCAMAMFRLMLWCQQRPVGDAYRLGFDAGKREGRRQAVKEYSARPSSPTVTPLRPAQFGLSEFNAKAKAKRDLVEI